MAEVNIPLLRKAVEWAEAEAARPAIECRWSQHSWITPADHRARELFADEELDYSFSMRQQVEAHCGTAYCIAGYVAQMLDERYATEEEVDGVELSVFAASALGIPSKHAAAQEGSLFSGFNTIEDVRRIAESLAGERL